MTRISKASLTTDAQALLQAASGARGGKGPAKTEAVLDGLLDLHGDASLELRAQRRASISKELGARRGQLGPRARAKLERLLTELVSVDLPSLRAVMDGPASSPEASLRTDPGVDRTKVQTRLRLMEPIEDWRHVEGITNGGPGRATIPTRLGPMVVDFSRAQLMIVENGGTRAPSDAEAVAMGVVLSGALAISSTDKTLVLSLVKALETAKGTLTRPPMLSSLDFAEVPKGLLDARFVDPRVSHHALELLLREQEPGEGPVAYASGELIWTRAAGLGSLSPDGKAQHIDFQAFSYEHQNIETLFQIATATGRTMHTTFRGIPVYAEPKDEPWRINSRLRSFSTSRGWVHHDSYADHRKSLASLGLEPIRPGEVVAVVRGLGGRYGDFAPAGLARIHDPQNMTELMLHLRDVLPPETLRNYVLHAVAEAQVPRGSEQAWLDTLKRVLTG